jgi:hypothetical protein
MKTLLLAVVTVHCFTAFALATPIAKLRDFELVDQYGKTRRYHFPKAMISLVAVTDCKGAGQLAPWIQSIYDRYRERIDIDGVADVSTIPKLLRPILTEFFKRQLAYSVMLDWDGSVVSQFGYNKNVANLYLIDRSGRIVRRLSGEASDKALSELFGDIDSGIADARQNGSADF